MQLRIFVEPQQGNTYDQLLTVARLSEQLGFDAFFRSDHYLKMGDVDGLPGPTDAWITLAGLARETSTIRLGTLVTSATFRYPGPLAISVAQVDQMSGGRVELGLGAGWFAEEHAAYGVPFPELGERFDRLEEQLQIVTGLWATPVGETFAFSGQHYEVSGSPALPKPAQTPRPPIIIGGGGKVKTPRLAATFADEFNLSFPAPEDIVPMYDRVQAACERLGRDPGTLIRSAAQIAVVGEDEAAFARRAAVVGREPDELRHNGVAGTVEQAAEKLATLAAQGAERVYLQVLDLSDLDHLHTLAQLIDR